MELGLGYKKLGRGVLLLCVINQAPENLRRDKFLKFFFENLCSDFNDQRL